MTKPKMTHQKPSAKKKSAEVTKPYEPTEREQTALDAFEARRYESPLFPKLKINYEGDTGTVELDHPDLETACTLLMEATGAASDAFALGILMQLTNAASKASEPNAGGLNFMLSVVAGIKPQDQMEAMLASQMAAVHMQTMAYARRLSIADTFMESEIAEKALNKLTRTFTIQLEALKKYRTGGQQKMTVEHVHVHEGGQAIVGNVQGGGGNEKNEGQPDAKATNA